MRRVIIYTYLLLFALPLFATPAHNDTLKKIDVTTAGADNVQLVLDLATPTQYKWFLLTQPERLVIDFPHTINQAALGDLPLTDTMINKIRAGVQPSDGLRLVVDFTQPTLVTMTSLPPTQRYAERLVLDLKTKTPVHPSIPSAALPVGGAAVTSTPHQVVKPANIAASTKVTNSAVKPVLSMSNNFPPRKIVVVLDPGHGGKDPGASGPGGLQEKNLVLGISRDVYKLLAEEPGVTVYMTRYGDYYIGLRQRLQVARRDKADIFIAIHADAYKDAYSTGASVFALSLRGATSEAARWLAAKENYSELGGVNLNGKNAMLRSVLIDLSQTATISSSLWLGSDVLRQMSKISSLHKGRVEQAPFVVLKSPDIPSILVETGFISNPAEERALSNSAYQQEMAQAIVAGVNQYIRQHPPASP